MLFGYKGGEKSIKKDSAMNTPTINIIIFSLLVNVLFNKLRINPSI
jgi:hypothetical protein